MKTIVGYEVIDSQTGKIVWSGSYAQRNIGRRVADKRDAQYGAVRYIPRPVFQEVSVEKTARQAS